MKNTTNLNILLLEDIAMIREGIKRSLESEIPNTTVFVAANYEDATGILLDSNIDVAFLDIDLGGKAVGGPTGSDLFRHIRQKEESVKTGFDVLNYIRSNKLSTRAVMLSGYIDEEIVLHSLKEGASGYMFKGLDGENIFYEAVETVLRGRIFLLESVLGHNKEIEIPESLTAREKQILYYVCQGYQSKEIAYKVHLEDATIRDYTHKLLKKFKVKNKIELKAEIERKGIVVTKPNLRGNLDQDG